MFFCKKKKRKERSKKKVFNGLLTFSIPIVREMGAYFLNAAHIKACWLLNCFSHPTFHCYPPLLLEAMLFNYWTPASFFVRRLKYLPGTRALGCPAAIFPILGQKCRTPPPGLEKKKANRHFNFNQWTVPPLPDDGSSFTVWWQVPTAPMDAISQDLLPPKKHAYKLTLTFLCGKINWT